MPEEVKLFGRVSLFGLVIGAIYWFLSYELVGTVMLIGFGVATGSGFFLLRRGARAGERREAAAAPMASAGPVVASSGDLAAAAGADAAEPVAFTNEPEGAFGDEGGAVPRGSLAPFWVGVGVATCVLGLVFSVWIAVIGLLPLLVGAVSWIRAAGHELDQVEQDR